MKKYETPVIRVTEFAQDGIIMLSKVDANVGLDAIGKKDALTLNFNA